MAIDLRVPLINILHFDAGNATHELCNAVVHRSLSASSSPTYPGGSVHFRVRVRGVSLFRREELGYHHPIIHISTFCIMVVSYRIIHIIG